MTFQIKTVMVLAAGLGTRMKPLTDERPKPMVEVGGKTLIDWVLDDATDAGIESAIVNVHYKAELLREHLAQRSHPAITLSDESALLLDTGGGVAAALPLINDSVFLVTNSDALWHHGLGPALDTLRTAWSGDMDALLLLADMKKAFGFDGAGDFSIGDDGAPMRRGSQPTAPTAYAGTQLVHRRLFDNHPEGAFSFNKLWDTALAAGRLKAVLHDDDWYHVGTPDAVEPTGRALTMESYAS
ncbi:MAG: nucleotidyltransferase family protein [Rhodospirillaceae bacterium]|nr:nucleotidyltransferase family protein [Rhodospirillaceae bacterium]